MQRMIVIVLGLSAVAMTGCAGPQAERTAVDCEALHQVVSTAPDGFGPIIGQQNVTRYGRVGRAKLQAYGNCSVFSSAGEPAVYICSEESAAQQTDSALLVEEVIRCLGQDWTRNELPSGGMSFEQRDVRIQVGKTDPQASGDSSVGLTVQRR